MLSGGQSGAMGPAVPTYWPARSDASAREKPAAAKRGYAGASEDETMPCDKEDGDAVRGQDADDLTRLEDGAQGSALAAASDRLGGSEADPAGTPLASPPHAGGATWASGSGAGRTCPLLYGRGVTETPVVDLPLGTGAGAAPRRGQLSGSAAGQRRAGRRKLGPGCSPRCGEPRGRPACRCAVQRRRVCVGGPQARGPAAHATLVRAVSTVCDRAHRRVRLGHADHRAVPTSSHRTARSRMRSSLAPNRVRGNRRRRQRAAASCRAWHHGGR